VGANASPALNHTMLVSIFRLTDLPVEILEQIFLHLPGQDVIKMEVVRRIVAILHDSSLLTFH